ncbi:protein PHLOEM PROTEIN 2-LIKE A10-like [Camellia sinensis]|uniref:protein PHLOEM PROTEIN 2-LIKE A10-like n=1 Tax=Camellia sinensis TaxID=4442 RepID=UPI001036ACBA|nr:protein PHLOEM PROTEIN 2-LIKE A10-like [Camellia sinensis]XP_028097435.1 protein PHLOEM PROTEIN 2-LIKE A10-like [Camellia sinensis]XP_028097436.1 protein PHLOEM PROTEIN 2-LIKE A10-like [Camellia sinensis]XP_028097437.1 protein PHLOEM PROTEIN 2-LIKE A10-like [Camellia sinensis]XP_028097438.1 protein PHLOEM PROTEIN 2-LIKE A10-like [Camellia sinensis]XP_028097439.1 protein PHLOEM PROTEIN 2-LIKE A10-like [Camellia sinensis]
MDLQLVKKGFDYTQKRRKWILLLAALGFTGYGVCKVYHSPSMVKKRKKLLKLLGVLISVAEAVSDSAEAIGVVSKDLKEFVQSDSDKIPNSLRQISKITLSEEFSESVVRVTSALTVGILRGYGSESRKDDGMSANSSFLDQVLDKLFSTSGSGFASTVVGSFARNMVVAFYSDAEPSWGSNAKNSTSLDHNDSELNSAPKWVNAICDEKFRELIGDCIQQFVSTAVAVYLDKTMNVNPYDELFSGLTNPKHERKMKDMLGSICNGGLETLIKTSNQVLTGANSNSSYSYSAIDDFDSRTTFNEELLGQEPPSTDPKARKSFYENEDHGWVNKMSSTLAVPSNRKLVLDLSGRVTCETVRSFLEFLLEKLWDGMRSSLNVVHEIVVDRGLEVVRYVRAISSAIVSICISLCLHMFGGDWILVPA